MNKYFFKHKKSLLFLFTAFLMLGLSACNKPQNNTQPHQNIGKKAKLDFYVMSQCPYGTQVEDAINPVIQEMGEYIDLNINYIASEKNDGTLNSLHGQPEVDEDIRQLCVSKYFPKNSLDFIVCQNKDIKNAKKNAKECAKNNNISFDKIETCFKEEGKTLLSDSSKISKKIEASASPTIYLNDKLYLGKRDTDTFKRFICQAINKEAKPCEDFPICTDNSDCIPQTRKIGICKKPNTKEANCKYEDAPVVNVTIISDKRCKKCENTKMIIKNLKNIFQGLEIAEYDYSQEQGQSFYKEHNLKYLPAVTFDKNVEKGESYEKIKSFLIANNDLYQLQLNSDFDPTIEICDNEIDDTANGKTDCDDDSCINDLHCREEKIQKLDLFVMSQCPYGTRALDAMKEVLPNFGDKINFNIHYIASQIDDKNFNSLHGQAEVDENIRQLCAKKYNPNEYLDYIWCRNPTIKDPNWEKCAESTALNLVKVKECSTGDEGKKLLTENIKLANELKIKASPTWLLNNNTIFSGIDANKIKTQYCSKNKVEGCEKTLTTNPQIPQGNCN